MKGIRMRDGKISQRGKVDWLPEWKLAHGTRTMTSASEEFATGLSEVIAVSASLLFAPSATCMWVTGEKTATTGNIILRLWKPAAADGTAANVTPVAATSFGDVSWIALGK